MMAVRLTDLRAAVPYCGRPPDGKDAAKIKPLYYFIMAH